MLLHRGAWNDDRYMLMKADAMTRDHRSQRCLPAEIRALDKDAAKVFTHLLEEESYPHFESRVMLAGEQGTGKTTIARYLVGKGPTRVRKSTDGIGLYTGLSYMDRETNTWLNGKQDFSLADVTISRSLRQKPLGPQVSSLSPELFTDLSNRHEKSPTASASVRFNEQQVIDKDRYKMPRIPAEMDTSRLKEPGHGNKPTKRIPDNKQSTNVSLDLYKHQDDPNEIETPVQKQHGHHQDETQLQNVPFDLDKTKYDSKDENQVPKASFGRNRQHDDHMMLVRNMPLDPNEKQDYRQDKIPVPKVLHDADSQHGHHLKGIPMSNVLFDSHTPSRVSKNRDSFQNELLSLHEQEGYNKNDRPLPNFIPTEEKQNEILKYDIPIHILSGKDSQQRDPHNNKAMASNLEGSDDQLTYSHEESQSEDVMDAIPMTNQQTVVIAATEDESKENEPNHGSPLNSDGKKQSILSWNDSLDQEQTEPLSGSPVAEKATTGLTQSVESVTNPRLITKLKRFFGVSKEVKEIKVSITEEHILKQSLKVGKKKIHQRHIAPVIIWDFGGQDIFYSTHQSFLSYRAIYLIVLDGSRTLDDPCRFDQYLPGKSGQKTARDYLRFWINTIVTYCKGSQYGFPKIMIVFTHKDKLKHSEVETAREKLYGDVNSMFQGTPLMSHLVIEDRIFVNAKNKNDPEMAKIETSIIRESKLQPTWGQNLPKCFIPLELEFENLIRKDINVISFDDLKKINLQHPIRPLTDAELKVFLTFQHAIGKILYFDEPGLDTHITLLPTYLIDAFKSIITDKQFCKGERQKEHLWNLMSQKGVIFKYAIEKLWRNGKYQRFEQHKDYLVSVMTHLDILVEPKRYDFKRNRIPTDFYFVASMVQAKDTTGYLQSPFLTDRNIAIAFNSNSAIIPPALSFRFITYCLSIFDVKKHGDRMEDMLFHRSAVFTIDPSLEIHILCEDDRIFVRLVHATNKVLILKDLASSICDCLKSALENISQLYIKTSSDNSELNVGTFEMNLCCSVAKDPCLLSIGEFNKIDGIWKCPEHKLDHEKYVMSSWITAKEIMQKCEITCPVTNEDFLREDLSAFHLRRLSILYDVDEIRELVTHLELPYIQWKDLFVVEPEPQLLKFKALCLCHEQSTLTFRKIKKAVEEGKIQNPHTLCKVMRGAFMDFDTDPEKWDLVPSDEDIDKTAPLIGNKSLFFLVELGMDLETWETINHRQTKRDLVKLNKDILDEWMLICKAKHVRPTMRMIAQAYTSIGKDIRVLENTLFN
ncbi:Hypothetical predicted protein [Mytilus galloprovincialis]|uniref:COR domain-containing protein n=1 Tax=Mytilus galloprovincialis TaxID=29158 RepID=A0A8B6CWV9_MYTGA|nr:Hypothetical predicted protein [Mytilus galloprovincialis]